LQAAIKQKYGMTAELVEGAGGIFEVYIDGRTVYSNQTTYQFPTDQEIFDQIDVAKK
jgi:selT/selW/selH-like putative selenoprotein